MTDELDDQYKKQKQAYSLKVKQSLGLLQQSKKEKDPSRKAELKLLAEQAWQEAKDAHQAMTHVRDNAHKQQEQRKKFSITKSAIPLTEKRDLLQEVRNASNVIDLETKRKEKVQEEEPER